MSNQSAARFLNTRPENEEDLTKLAEQLIRQAGVGDILPTPLEQLYAAAMVKEHQFPIEPDNNVLQSMLGLAGDVLHRALQKVRGMTDLRERAVYIARTDSDSSPRLRFVRGHELAHNVIPWQRINGIHIDKDVHLRPDTRREFDREANFMSGEMLYQGRRFKDRARSYSADLDAVQLLAQQHGTSLQSTLWRYAEVQDERILVAMYYLNRQTGSIALGKCVASSSFKRRFPDIVLPTPLPTDHPWRAAIELCQDMDGDISLDCGSDGICDFRWQARWTTYALLVLVRKMPKFAVLGQFFHAA